MQTPPINQTRLAAQWAEASDYRVKWEREQEQENEKGDRGTERREREKIDIPTARV